MEELKINEDNIQFKKYLENNGIVDLFYTFLEELYKMDPKPQNPLYEIKKLTSSPEDPDVIKARKNIDEISRLQDVIRNLKLELNIVKMKNLLNANKEKRKE